MHFLSITLLLLTAVATPLCAGDRTIDKRFIPDAQAAATVGNWALWHNPAGLAFMGGGESSAAYMYEWSELGNRHHGGLNLAFNILDMVTLAGGINTQQAYESVARRTLGSDLSGIVGGAFKIGDYFGFGISFLKSHNFLTEKSSSTLVTFGWQSRIARFLSIGGFYEEVNDGFFSAPNLTAGISVRPYKEYVTIGFDAQFRPITPRWEDGFRFAPKLGIKTAFNGFGVSLNTEIPGLPSGFKKPIFSVALELNLANLGVTFSGLINPSAKNYGVGGFVRASTQEWETSLAPSGLWVELHIDADGNLDEGAETITEKIFDISEDPISVLAMLKRMERDKSIGGLVLHISGFAFGDARTQEWRDALVALRRANKAVVVYLDNPSERDYYIATAANKIMMNNQATLDLSNFRSTLVYFATMLDEFGIKAQSVVAGDYKTAPNSWTKSRPSKEEIEVHTNRLNDFYEHLVSTIANERKITKSRLIALLDRGEITATDAYREKLVDELVTPHNVVDAIETSSKTAMAFFPQYENRTIRHSSWIPRKRIAVIPIYNDIVDGRFSPGIFSQFFPSSGAKNIVDEINDAVSDPNVYGIILRIDSPGGDALAGSRIHEAVMRARESKPVVASMADVAASAAYLIAAGANQVYALPNTLTGSIGVFTLMFSAEKLANKLGVFAKEITMIENPGPTLFRPMSPGELKETQRMVDWSYQNFMESVAAGLGIDKAQVAKFAQGRVWLGHEALEGKLVHSLGGFSEAVDSVRALAKIPADEIVMIDIRQPDRLEPFSVGTALFSLFGKSKAKNPDVTNLSPVIKPFEPIIRAHQMNGTLQARLPYYVMPAREEQ